MFFIVMITWKRSHVLLKFPATADSHRAHAKNPLIHCTRHISWDILCLPAFLMLGTIFAGWMAINNVDRRAREGKRQKKTTALAWSVLTNCNRYCSPIHTSKHQVAYNHLEGSSSCGFMSWACCACIHAMFSLSLTLCRLEQDTQITEKYSK